MCQGCGKGAGLWDGKPSLPPVVKSRSRACCTGWLPTRDGACATGLGVEVGAAAAGPSADAAAGRGACCSLPSTAQHAGGRASSSGDSAVGAVCGAASAAAAAVLATLASASSRTSSAGKYRPPPARAPGPPAGTGRMLLPAVCAAAAGWAGKPNPDPMPTAGRSSAAAEAGRDGGPGGGGPTRAAAAGNDAAGAGAAAAAGVCVCPCMPPSPAGACCVSLASCCRWSTRRACTMAHSGLAGPRPSACSPCSACSGESSSRGVWHVAAQPGCRQGQGARRLQACVMCGCEQGRRGRAAASVQDALILGQKATGGPVLDGLDACMHAKFEAGAAAGAEQTLRRGGYGVEGSYCG